MSGRRRNVDEIFAVADLSAAALDRRLARETAAPIVVAFSGGGDSLALLLGAKAWAGRVGRRLLVVTVDHRLQADSARWSAWCADRAARLDVAHRILVWDGDKPATGLAAAARAARHGLLADAARAVGARVILMGHTADDRLEARLMRAQGGAVSEPREWSPSPVWPQGRDLFLLRPLLSARRADIRLRLADAGETWIDDPANADPRHARARARLELAGGGVVEHACTRPAPPLDDLTISPAGDIVLGPRASRSRLLGPALLCASGTDRPPRRDRRDRLLARIAAGDPFAATLSGARIESDGRTVRISREAGEMHRSGRPASVALTTAPIVWDGRFEMTAKVEGLALRPLAGMAARLDRNQRAALACIDPCVRKSLPAILDAEGAVTSPILAADDRIRLRPLVESRFLAACGAVECEADIKVHGENARDTLNR